jgi:hypothetical protein
MSQINKQLWKEHMGDIPMPENCTYWQFAAARDELWKQRDNDDAKKAITELGSVKANRPDLAETLNEMIKQEQGKFRL